MKITGVNVDIDTKFIGIAMAIAIIGAMILLFFKAPPCEGDYTFKLGGDEYFLFECRGNKRPKPDPGIVIKNEALKVFQEFSTFANNVYYLGDGITQRYGAMSWCLRSAADNRNPGGMVIPPMPGAEKQKNGNQFIKAMTAFGYNFEAKYIGSLVIPLSKQRQDQIMGSLDKKQDHTIKNKKSIAEILIEGKNHILSLNDKNALQTLISKMHDGILMFKTMDKELRIEEASQKRFINTKIPDCPIPGL